MTTARRELMLLMAAACLILTPITVLAQDDAIDMRKARELRQKQKQGQILTPEESAYLKKALAARKGSSREKGKREDRNAEITTPIEPEKEITKATAERAQIPGMIGFGANYGGKGGKEYIVTNLNDSGPGSLREALEAEGKRYITSGVCGYIHLKSPIRISHGDMTFDGSTGPGPIVVTDYGIRIDTGKNFVFKHLCLYTGSKNMGSEPLKDWKKEGNNLWSTHREELDQISVFRCFFSEDPDSDLAQRLWGNEKGTLRNAKGSARRTDKVNKGKGLEEELDLVGDDEVKTRNRSYWFNRNNRRLYVNLPTNPANGVFLYCQNKSQVPDPLAIKCGRKPNQPPLPENVWFENVSFGLGGDITVISGANNATFKNCLFYHPLSIANHPKRQHPCSMLIKTDGYEQAGQYVLIDKCAFIRSERRNPRVAAGVKVAVVNCYAKHGTKRHFQADLRGVKQHGVAKVDVVGYCSDSKPSKTSLEVMINDPKAKIYIKDYFMGGRRYDNPWEVAEIGERGLFSARDGINPAKAGPVPKESIASEPNYLGKGDLKGLKILPSTEVKEHVRKYAGAFYWARSPICREAISLMDVDAQPPILKTWEKWPEIKASPGKKTVTEQPETKRAPLK